MPAFLLRRAQSRPCLRARPLAVVSELPSHLQSSPSLPGPSFCSLAQLSNTELLRETEAQRGLRGYLVHPVSSGPAQALGYILLKRELD